MAADEGAREPLHRALGLTDDEYDDIVEVLDRAPNPLELALFGVMWSEHCSYKNTRPLLKGFPTEKRGPTPDFGRVLVKALKRSQIPGMWTLLSNTEPPIYDVALDWAALVREMRPR